MLRLDPVEVRGDDGVQLGLWGGRTQADEWAVRAVARLVAVAGEQQVLVPAAQGGRQPHDAYTWVPAVTADLFEPAERLAAAAGAVARPPALALTGARAPSAAARGGARRGRSSGEGDGPRGSVRAAGDRAPLAGPLDGRVQPVQAWAGPWPVEERWWDAARPRRLARFQVLTDRRSLLLLAVERGQWHLAAEYA